MLLGSHLFLSIIAMVISTIINFSHLLILLAIFILSQKMCSTAFNWIILFLQKYDKFSTAEQLCIDSGSLWNYTERDKL